MEYDFTNKPDLASSVNYRFSCQVMKDIFFNKMVDIAKVHGNRSETNKLVLTALLLIVRYFKISIPDEFKEMPIHFVKGERALGVVIEVPNAVRECECNFIGMVQKDDGEKLYYTNEYYASSDTFGLCRFTPDMHIVLNKHPKTLEEFISAII